VGVGYNTDFRVSSLTVNGGNPLTFGYDRDGFLETAGALGIKRHVQHGLIERDSLGPIKTSTSYTTRGALAEYTAMNGASTLFQTSYTRDSLERVTQVTETVLDTTVVFAFTYDTAGRLAEVRRDAAITATYEYDPNGNRLHLTTSAGTITGTYDAQDRLTSYGLATYTYGSNGELRRKTGADGITTYSYDALGNLAAVTLPDATQITYAIDGQNRRVGKKINGTLVQGFIYQSQINPVAELDGSQQIISRFVYGTRSNVPDYMIKAGATYRLVSDQLGSVRTVVNIADGTIAQRLDYDEFGRIVRNTAPGFQPFGYAGGLTDDHTRLVRFGTRDYDPEVGRWTAKDPIGFNAGDANLYAYVHNDPINYIDPTGTDENGVLRQIWDAVRQLAPGVNDFVNAVKKLADFPKFSSPEDPFNQDMEEMDRVSPDQVDVESWDRWQERNLRLADHIREKTMPVVEAGFLMALDIFNLCRRQVGDALRRVTPPHRLKPDPRPGLKGKKW
jgi:RHS repeat-associated protein